MAGDLAVDETDGTVSIVDADRETLLARYDADTAASKPGFDVLATPPSAEAGGRNLVLAAPHDHSWHLGTFFCQKLVDGINCWESEALDGAGKLHGYAEHKRYEIRTDDGADAVEIAQEATWKSSAGEELLEDTREIVVHAPGSARAAEGDDRDARGYFVTWEQTLAAREETRHLSSETIHGHYSGLSTRFARSLADGRVLLPGGTDPGTTSPPRDVSGPRGRWCDYSGPLDGKRGPGDPWTAGIATFDHPDNEPHPPRWFVMTEPFGFVAANPTWGRVEVLEPGNSRTWQWGLWIHGGTPDERTLEGAYETFTGLVG